MEKDVNADPNLQAKWLIVKKWTEEARYQQWNQVEAEELYNAITDSTLGVRQSIKIRW